MNRRVAVIGGGASGSIVAAHLLARLSQGDEVMLIERNPDLAKGVAYGTQHNDHRLNVRAENMSADPDKPDHLVEWLAGQGFPQTIAKEFLPRPLYAKYLHDFLTQRTTNSPATFKHIQATAESLTKNGSELDVVLSDGSTVSATHAVLATGHLGPHIPAEFKPFQTHPRFIPTPWQGDLGTFKDQDVLIIGTGLTTVDTVMSLRRTIGSGHIYARSRRGLAPQAHIPNVSLIPIQLDAPPKTARELVHQIVKLARDAGENWRDVVDGCRDQSSTWWQALPWEERLRFLRRIQPFWDVHRHRIPEDVAEALGKMQAAGTLSISSARSMKVTATEEGFHIGAQGEQLNVDWIINCTGPESNCRAAQVPIFESAIRAGLAQYDPLGIGFIIDDRQATDPDGRVFTLGSLCRGCLGESIAMPEIRVQAATIAQTIA